MVETALTTPTSCAGRERSADLEQLDALATSSKATGAASGRDRRLRRSRRRSRGR
jgi:hypothetical protein